MRTTIRLRKDFSLPRASILNNPQHRVCSLGPHLPPPATSPSQYPSYTTFPPTPRLFFPVTPNQLFIPGTKSRDVSAVCFSLRRFPIPKGWISQPIPVICSCFLRNNSTSVFLRDHGVYRTTSEGSTSSFAIARLPLAHLGQSSWDLTSWGSQATQNKLETKPCPISKPP